MKKVTILIVLLFAAIQGVEAQKIPARGVPLLTNYTPEEVGIEGKAWQIQSASNGIVYLATDQGLLEFDGSRWALFPGSKGFTRSIFIASDSTVYAGADQDFGRWQRDSLLQFGFTSLNPFSNSSNGLNEEFWGTYQLGEDYIFVSYDNIYVYRQQQLTKIGAPSRFTGSCAAGGNLYLSDAESGLLAFDGQNLRPLFRFPSSHPIPPQIVGAQPAGEELLIVTRRQGIFKLSTRDLVPFNAEVSAYLKRDQVFSFTPIGATHYAFGTIQNGVYITDLAGNIIQHLNKQKGLLNNTILSMHYTPQGKLWLGLDFGLASVDLWSDITYFLDQRGQVGTSYAGLLHAGIFYLGTNQGLYATEWASLKNNASLPDFNLVPGSSGQVWTLAEVDGTILCGHDRGLFQVSGNSFLPVHDEAGVLAITKAGPDHLLTGNYNGVSRYRKSNNRWSFAGKIPPVQGACNQLIFDDNQHLWLNLPNFGVIKATLDENYQITGQQIFPDSLFVATHHQLFTDASGLNVRTGTTTYHYRPATNSFEPAGKAAAPDRVAHRLPGVLQPIPLNDTCSFIPAHNGFALKNLGYAHPATSTATLSIRSVEAFSNDTTCLVARGSTLPFRLNNVRFHFTVPQQPQVLYQHKLENHTEEWSNWSAEPQVSYWSLGEGEYIFNVRAKVDGRELPAQTFSFSIDCPWYRSWTAYVIYGFTTLALLLLNYLWQARKLRQQKQQFQARQQESDRLRAAVQEKELIRKQYGMLEEALGEIKKQLRSKTIELAKKAKDNDEKGRILNALKEKVDKLQQEAGPIKFQLTQLSRMLANYEETEDNSFSLQMEELNKDFLTRLGQRFPELTTYDLRLCTYLKSGLTTREIAELMNVLPSSVNVSRSRLRKKLQLSSKKDLYKFLSQFA